MSYTAVRGEEMAFNAVFFLTAVWKRAELGQRCEYLRPEVTVISNDVTTLTVGSKPTDQLLLLQHHDADRCSTDSYQCSETSKLLLVTNVDYFTVDNIYPARQPVCPSVCQLVTLCLCVYPRKNLETADQKWM